ncbi:MAG: glycosyltransferase [Pseudobutyrivibrio sp.]|uniref:glycosyltransferase family 2 protein n=1 Tax=Pseudobutyrivibrio sp. TaxID=2014367 RepID=UPI0025E0FD3D|nr:glycosyltransferase [Pseudobutyrivibrio sp.]MBQ6463052.1 glycosyltransferase [Pseudobutyrivibrio sp.]
MELSIIIPIFKVEKYIEKCLESILKQSFSDMEIICVNDATPDLSLNIVKRIKDKNDNITILNHPINKGLSAARNTGLKHSQGKYVWFIDSDDYIKDGSIAQLVQKMEKDSLDVLYFNKTCVSEEGYRSCEKTDVIELGENEVITGKAMFNKSMQCQSFKSMNAYTQMFKRKFLVENNIFFYEGIVHEDFLFYFQCAMSAKRVGNYDRSFYYYRIRKGSIMSEVTKLRKQSMFVTFLKVIEYWKKNELNELDKVAIKRFAAMIYHECLKYKEKISYKDDFDFLDDVDKFLYSCMMNYRYVQLTDEELLELKNSNSIWIYGAGKVASELINILHENYINNIRGILVTEKTENDLCFFGWEIKDLKNVNIEKDASIIIATTGNKKKEMEKIIKQKGEYRIIFASKE